MYEEITPKYVVAVVLAVIATAILFIGVGLASASFTRIPTGTVGVVLRLGALEKTIPEGLFWRTPFLQQVILVDTQVQKEQVGVMAASKDLQDVTTTVALNYRLSSEEVGTMYQQVGVSYKEKLIDPAIQEAVKAATAKYTAEQLITERPLVKDDMKRLLVDRLAKEHITVDDLSIVNFAFSRAFNEAIEAKVTAEQNALAAKNKLEQVKFEASQQIEKAKAEAETIRIQANAITSQGGIEYVRLKTVERWDGKLPVTMVPGSALPFLDIK